LQQPDEPSHGGEECKIGNVPSWMASVADECNCGTSGRSRIRFLGCVICQLFFVAIHSSSLKMISRTFLQVTATELNAGIAAVDCRTGNRATTLG